MKITTFNANGIRAAARKGFFDWLEQRQPDVLCVQETKAQEHQLEGKPEFFPEGYHVYYSDAEKKGYSGVALMSRREPDRVERGLGFEVADTEGRYIRADFGKLSVASLYMPSGTSGDHRQQIKYEFLDRFYRHLKQMKEKGRQYIICADWNICHKEIDLKNWKANQKNSGFLPEERAWLDSIYDALDYRDAFRLVNREAEQYSWWSQRGGARERNVGWRLDYHVVTPGLVDRVGAAEIYTGENFSDHAPVTQAFDVEGLTG